LGYFSNPGRRPLHLPRIVETFTEVETAKGDTLARRPKLAAALKAARKLKAPVVVAKLDRLSRDVHFVAAALTGFTTLRFEFL
jgi:DNA invertase Pin-like site-specific DNA recombinase